MKILLLGIGAIGGIIASKLLQAGYNCTLITANEHITTNIQKNGLIVNDDSEKNQSVVEPLKVFTFVSQINEQFDYIFYMMKATRLEKAIQETKHLLSPRGFAVSFQNGIVFNTFLKYFNDRVITASVIFNSVMSNPGIYTVSKYEKIIIGKINNKGFDLGLSDLREILSYVTTCEISDNILGLCWSKLAINCSINALTAVSGSNLGVILSNNFAKDMFLAIYRETVDVATKLGIKLENIRIDPYLLYQNEETSFYKKTIQSVLLRQIRKKYANIYPSMLQDIKRGRKTEINFLNGYISYLGKKFGILTPINSEMTSLIKKIELNFLKPNISLLKIASESTNIENQINSLPISF